MMTRYTLPTVLVALALLLSPVVSNAQSRADLLSGKYTPNVRAFHAEQRGGGTPANDECASPEILTVGADCTNPTPGDNTLATESELGPACDGTNDSLYIDVWYSFNSGTNTSVDVDVTPSDLMTDWVLVVLDACDGIELLCAIQPVGPRTVTVTANTNYVVRVYSNTQFGLPGPFTICVTGTPPPPPPPANDDCAGAMMLTAAVDCVLTDGTTASATESQPADSCNGFLGIANDDVWYSFVATATEMTVSATGNTGFDAVVELFEGSCGSLTEIGCADATVNGGLEEVPQSGLTVGSTYLVRLFHYSTGDPTDAGFTICVTEGLGGIGIGERGTDERLSLFPNPTAGDLWVTWPGSSGDVRIELLDMTGRAVFAQERYMAHGQTATWVVPHHVEQGTYAVRLTNGTLGYSGRVVVN
jgi:hypothetical protein